MNKNNTKILALKYRPRIFKELIGQEVIAETISNAIKLKKTPNVFIDWNKELEKLQQQD